MLKKQYSSVGQKNLAIIDKADNFTNWLFDQIKPFMSRNILELGSGEGTYSKKIIQDFPQSNIFLSDIDQKYVDKLKKRYYLNKNVHVLNINVENTDDYKFIQHKIDTIFAINVLEHIKNDILALRNIATILPKNGRIILLVPAHKILYNCIDKEIGHYRRYNKVDIYKLAKMSKLKVEKTFYFNIFAMSGWYINGNILRRGIINEKAMGLYNKSVPLFKWIEKYVLRNRMGISLVVILKHDIKTLER